MLLQKQIIIERLINVLIILAGLIFLVSNFIDLNSYIFQMSDDYVFPDAARTFLERGEYHWAAAKPGIVLLAGLFGLTSPMRIMILFMGFGFLAAGGLFLLCKSLFENTYISLIPSFLWITSSFFFYYSRTEHLIFVAFYLLGLWLCFEGFRRGVWWKYYLGCFLLGYAVLCHYVLLFYLPVVFIFFVYQFYKGENPFLYSCLRTGISFLAPILLLDTFALGSYVLLGKKNWPFLYSVWGQHKVLSTCVGCNFNWDAFLVLPRLFWKAEYKVVVILIVISILLLLFRLLKSWQVKVDVKYLFIFIIFSPTIFLILRFYLGYLTNLRAFGAVLPVFYLLIAFLFIVLFSKKSYKYLFYLVFLFCFFRVYMDQEELKRIHKTGYFEASEYLNNSDFDVIVYYGQKKTWEQIVSDREFLPLNVENDAYAILKNEQRRTAFFQNIYDKIFSGKKVCFICTNLGCYSLSCMRKKFDMVLEQRLSLMENKEAFSLESMKYEDYKGGGANILIYRISV